MARVIALRLCFLVATIAIMCSACTLLTDFEVSDLTVNPETAYSGDKIMVTVDVTNSGYITGDHKVVLKRDGAKWMTEDVTVDSDTSREVSFSWVENPIGQAEKKTIEVSVGDLRNSFTLLGRKKMDAFVRIETDGIVVVNANDYTWTNVGMQLDVGVKGGGYVYNYHGPIAPSDSRPDGLFVVYWWQFVKDETGFNFSTTTPEVLRITAETEWGDDIMWSGGNVNGSLFEEVLST